MRESRLLHITLGLLVFLALALALVVSANTSVSTERAVQGSGLCDYAAYDGCER